MRGDRGRVVGEYFDQYWSVSGVVLVGVSYHYWSAS